MLKHKSRRRKLMNKRFNLLFIIVNIFKVPFMFGRMIMYVLLFIDTLGQIYYHGEELFTSLDRLNNVRKHRNKNKKNKNKKQGRRVWYRKTSN